MGHKQRRREEGGGEAVKVPPSGGPGGARGHKSLSGPPFLVYRKQASFSLHALP